RRYVISRESCDEINMQDDKCRRIGCFCLESKCACAPSSQPTGLTQCSVDSCRECGKPSERTHLLASRDIRLIERAMQDLDRLVIGFPIDRVRRAILAAMGERKARRILPTGADAVDQLGCQCERAQRFRPHTLDRQQRFKVSWTCLIG